MLVLAIRSVAVAVVAPITGAGAASTGRGLQQGPRDLRVLGQAAYQGRGRRLLGQLAQDGQGLGALRQGGQQVAPVRDIDINSSRT